MPRIITASEVDRLHEAVANLTARVSSLEGSVYGPPAPAQPSELFESLAEPEAASEGTRSDADEVVEAIVGRLPSDEAGPSDQDGEFLQP